MRRELSRNVLGVAFQDGKDTARHVSGRVLKLSEALIHRMELLGLCGQLRSPPTKLCGLRGALPPPPASYPLEHKRQKCQKDESPHPDTPRAKRHVETRLRLGRRTLGDEGFSRLVLVNNNPLANPHRSGFSVPFHRCNASTLTPYRAAISESVSPGSTCVTTISFMPALAP